MDTTYPSTREPGAKAGSRLEGQRESIEHKSAAARDEARHKAHAAYGELRESTRDVARQSGEYLKKVVADQQSCVVGKLEEYSSAAKAACDKLKAEDDNVAADKVRQAANGLDRVAGYLRESDPSTLFSDASRVARRRPELVFGGMFIAGLAIARVLKASAPEGPHDTYDDDLPGSYRSSGDVRPFAGSSAAASPPASPATPPAIPPVTPAVTPTTPGASTTPNLPNS